MMMKGQRGYWSAALCAAVVCAGTPGQAEAVGIGRGYIKTLKVEDGSKFHPNQVLSITFRGDPYSRSDGIEMHAQFAGSFDANGLCPNTSSLTSRAGLDVASMSDDPLQKTLFTMLMSAMLLKQPVEVDLGSCIPDRNGVGIWEIKSVSYP